MPEPLADQIVRRSKQAEGLYHRLIIVAAPSGSGKTAALQDAQKRIGAPILNVDLELSRMMLELTQRQRALQLPRLLAHLAGQDGAKVVLLDNIEILFDVDLKQDPLRVLQGLSRDRTIVASWSGDIENDHLVYASPGHPEYRRYRIHDFLVVSHGDTLSCSAT